MYKTWVNSLFLSTLHPNWCGKRKHHVPKHNITSTRTQNRSAGDGIVTRFYFVEKLQVNVPKQDNNKYWILWLLYPNMTFGKLHTQVRTNEKSKLSRPMSLGTAFYFIPWRASQAKAIPQLPHENWGGSPCPCQHHICRRHWRQMAFILTRVGRRAGG